MLPLVLQIVDMPPLTGPVLRLPLSSLAPKRQTRTGLEARMEALLRLPVLSLLLPAVFGLHPRTLFPSLESPLGSKGAVDLS